MPIFVQLTFVPTFHRACTRIQARCLTKCVEGLHNARDLAYVSGGLLRSGAIYRGAAPTMRPTGTQASVEFLHTVRCFIDLRSRQERRQDSVRQVQQLCGPDYFDRERHIPILNRRRVVRGLVRCLPTEQVAAIVKRLLVSPLSARRSVVERIDEGGLVFLNRIIIHSCGKQLASALHTILDHVEEQNRTGSVMKRPRTTPIYIFCSAGKDRTGLLSALLLSLVGVPRGDIIKDYVKSAETWENGPYYLREEYCSKLSQAL